MTPEKTIKDHEEENTYDPIAALDRLAREYYAYNADPNGFLNVEPGIKKELLLAYKKGREDAVEYIKSSDETREDTLFGTGGGVVKVWEVPFWVLDEACKDSAGGV